jgi:malate dehydrogenase
LTIPSQPLSLLLKISPLVDELSLYDVVNTPGVAADLSHIASPAKVSGYLPPNDGAKSSFKDADVIIIPAGIPRKRIPKMNLWETILIVASRQAGDESR